MCALRDGRGPRSGAHCRHLLIPADQRQHGTRGEVGYVWGLFPVLRACMWGYPTVMTLVIGQGDFPNASACGAL